MSSLQARFWAKVNKTEYCWEWTGRPNGTGYGDFKLNNKVDGKINVRVHRYSWTISFGPIPNGLKVCHKCDNPICVRPEHLFLGTDADNARDKVSKGRQSCLKGEANPDAVLTDAQVISIRLQYTGAWGQQTALAKKYNVSQHTIWRVVKGKSWKHI